MTDEARYDNTTLEEIKEFSQPSYDSFDLNRLISFTIHWLQQRFIATSFENVVITAFRMFPAKFALEGYPEYPDAARINRALLQLGPKYRNWARGSVQKGFILTESGLSEVRKVNDALSGAQLPSRPKAKRGVTPRTLDLAQELEPIEHSGLFSKWASGKLTDGTLLELLDLLNAYAYTPPRALRDRLTFLKNTAAQMKRSDLLEFLDSVHKQFAQQLKDRGE